MRNKELISLIEGLGLTTNKGCWEYEGSNDSKGYGRFTVDGKMDRAHRQSYRMFKGEIAEHLCVCHTCDNPRCINPKHLFLGTHEENMADARTKGRHKRKLSDEQVRAIRTAYAVGAKPSELARLYGVSYSLVHCICSGKRREAA